MSRDEQERLRDIKDAIAAIRRHLEQADETTAGKEDALLHDALLFRVAARQAASPLCCPAQRGGHSSTVELRVVVATMRVRFPLVALLAFSRHRKSRRLSLPRRSRRAPRSASAIAEVRRLPAELRHRVASI
jgi:hypothetical protein